MNWELHESKQNKCDKKNAKLDCNRILCYYNYFVCCTLHVVLCINRVFFNDYYLLTLRFNRLLRSAFVICETNRYTIFSHSLRYLSLSLFNGVACVLFRFPSTCLFIVHVARCSIISTALTDGFFRRYFIHYGSIESSLDFMCFAFCVTTRFVEFSSKSH